MRQAFGTFLALPDPMSFSGDASYVATRWRADPDAAFAAEAAGQLAGSNFATRWGSFGFFGPLTTRPDLWDRGFGKRLMEPVMACFERWDTRHAGLFTFAHSQKHVGLYQKFGFWPQFLTAIMSKPVAAPCDAPRCTRYSELSQQEQDAALRAAADLTDALLGGLEVSSEVRSVERQALGETLLLWSGERLAGIAICHCGAGSEAGSGACYVKFAAARPGPAAAAAFGELLQSCEHMAAGMGLSRLVAGCNAARQAAFLLMQAHGFRTDYQGVAMQRANDAGYNRADVFAIDDWR